MCDINDMKIEIINKEEPIISENLKEIINIIKNISEEVFQELGTGFSEYIYHRALEISLRINNINYDSKKMIPINYKGYNVGYGEADLIVYRNDQIVIIELKAITNPPREIEIAQVKTYLKNLEKSDIGIIINFPQPGTKIAKDNIDFKIIEK